MKKKIYLFTTILAGTALLFLSSCLKDKSHYVDFGSSGTWVNFPKGGAVNFGSQAITEGGDTIVRVFAVNIASPQLQSTATTVTFKVNDQATVDAYNKSQSIVSYDLMPADAYKIAASKVTIAAGQLFAYDSVTFYKNKLDPSKSYMMPITITNTTNGKLTANLNTLLYHFIGNDFAGEYNQDFHRWNASDSTNSATFVPSQSYDDEPGAVFNPVTPTQFEVYSGYAGGIYRYEVTFTKTGNGSSATYSNFAVTMNADDVALYQPDPNDINLATKPTFVTAPDPTKQYTYAQSLQLFWFSFGVTSGATAAPRYLSDRYYK